MGKTNHKRENRDYFKLSDNKNVNYQNVQNEATYYL